MFHRILIAGILGVVCFGGFAQESRPADPVSEEIQRLAQAGRLVEAVEALDALIAKGSQDARHHAARFSFLGALYKQESVVHRPRLAAAARSYAALLPEGESRTTLQNLAAKLEADDRAVASAPTSRPQKAGLTGMQRIELGTVEADLTAAAAETTREKQLAGFRAALARLTPLLEALPDEVRAWRLLAIAALQLDDEDNGRRAALALLRLGAVESDDVGLQKVLIALNAKDWLKEAPKVDVHSVASWAEVISVRVDPQVVPDVAWRKRIERTGWPWRVRDRATQIEMLLVPPGTFRRGASPGDTEADSDEQPQHDVEITQPFYLARYEVLRSEWSAVMGKDPSRGTNGVGMPVDSVSHDALTDATNGFFAKAGNGMRLPSEAEWEYACRAELTGSVSRPRYGALDEIAWHDGNSNSSSHKVGGKTANALGFHDMIGNLWEWCADVYDAAKYKAMTGSVNKNPSTPDGPGPRVLRGGSRFYGPLNCRSSNRIGHDPSNPDGFVGFRPARTCR